MSNSRAIAAVTATLEKLLGAISEDVFGAVVTNLPPDKAHEDSGNRINLFLYRTSVNTAWSNMDMPRQVKPGELGHPPLALNLHYLLTAYGEEDSSVEYASHRILGRAMSILHDQPVLDRQAIKEALPNNDLHAQIERVRLTPLPLSVDEISKLWTIFQTPYQISVAYRASVVLIESTRPMKASLPVLRRGREDRGVISQPDLISPLPTLTRIELPGRQPSLQFREVAGGLGGNVIVGDELIIHGHRLDGDEALVRFVHPRLTEDEARDIAGVPPEPEDITPTKITIKLSDTAAAYTRYPAGFYRLAVILTRTEEGEPVTRFTNELSFPLGPRVVIPPNPVGPDPDDADRLLLTLNCRPHVWAEQRVVVLLGSSEVPARPRDDKIDTLTFDVTDVPAGENYLVRLRVDGVDSLPVKDYDAVPLTFDEDQMVSIDE